MQSEKPRWASRPKDGINKSSNQEQMSKTIDANIMKGKFNTQGDRNSNTNMQRHNIGKPAKQIRAEAEQDIFWSDFNAQKFNKTHQMETKDASTTRNDVASQDPTQIGSSKNPLTANENTRMPKLKSKIGMDRNSVVVPNQQ